MNGSIDWAAMPAIVELYGIDDVECFIAKLEAVRDHKRMVDGNG